MVDNDDLVSRVSHVFLFGTPNMGIRNELGYIFANRQVKDMVEESPFITNLRARWAARFGASMLFQFWAVAAEADQFSDPALDSPVLACAVEGAVEQRSGGGKR